MQETKVQRTQIILFPISFPFNQFNSKYPTRGLPSTAIHFSSTWQIWQWKITHGKPCFPIQSWDFSLPCYISTALGYASQLLGRGEKNKHYKLYRPYPGYYGLNKSLTRWCPVISWHSELGHLAPGYHSAPQTHLELPKDHHIAEGRFFGATTPGCCVACSDRGGVSNAFHHDFVWGRDLILTIAKKSGKYFKEIN